MARNIDDISNLVRYICRLQKGVYITYPQIMANLDAGQLDALEEWFAPYGSDQKLHDALRPLRVYYQFTSDAAGFVDYPEDYLHVLGTAFTVTGSTVNEITMVDEDEFVNALNSQLRSVSLSAPIAKDTATGFSIYPQSTQTGFFNYLKRPATPVFGFTQVGRQITYDPLTSTQLEFSDAYINNIIAKSLRYAGINMSEAEISAFADKYNQETK